MGYISNKGFKIIETVGFILMVVSIVTLLCVMHELNEVNKDIKELRVITNRKQSMNVSINDIKDIGIQNDILLSEEQIQNVLREYDTIVMDKAEGWDELIKHLIVKQATIQILIEKNK